MRGVLIAALLYSVACTAAPQVPNAEKRAIVMSPAELVKLEVAISKLGVAAREAGEEALYWKMQYHTLRECISEAARAQESTLVCIGGIVM